MPIYVILQLAAFALLSLPWTDVKEDVKDLMEISSPLQKAVDKEFAYLPQPGFQTEIHRRKEDVVTIGGAKGPGKTHGMMGEAGRQLANPHYHAIFFRRTFKRSQEIIDRGHEMYHDKFGAVWKADEHRWIFPSKAKIEVSHMENENSKADHQGKEYTAIFWDQIEEFTETQFDFVSAANRTSHPGLRCYQMASHNPGGIGHVWVNRRFVQGKVPGQTYYMDFKLPNGQTIRRTYCFIRGNVYENKALLTANPQYLGVLMALPPKMRKAMMDGDYDILEGQYFEEWSSLTHVVRPFEIPKEWAIYQSMDWGYEAPLSCHWWAVPPAMDHVYCVREYYQNHVRSPEAAKAIHEISQEMFGDRYVSQRRIKAMYCDPSIFADKGDSGKAISEDFSQVMREQVDGRPHILTLVPSNNDRVPGWNVFRNMLAMTADGKPFAQWFSTCKHAIETIPTLVHDENHPEDLDSDGEDHAADDSRYFFIERFGPNKIIIPKPYDKLAETSPASYREWKNVDEKFFSRNKRKDWKTLGEIGV